MIRAETKVVKAIWRLHRAHSTANPDYRKGWNDAIAAAAKAAKEAEQ